jgi:hypothetical protein
MNKEILRIIIAGSRDFNDYALLRKETLRIIKESIGKINRENVTIVSGAAKGADTLGERFAREFGLSLQKFPAQWNKYGNSAGYRRNEQMADFAKAKNEENAENVHGMLIAFWDGKSPGTKHMIELAKNKKLDVYVVKYIEG